jgi:hypothetical protein
MDTVRDIITAIVALIPLMLALGTGWKWLPPFQKLLNEGVIPLFNLVLGLLVTFAGGAAVAHASVFGDILREMGGPEKLFAVIASVLLSSKLHDKIIKPLTPPSPALKKIVNG